MVASLLRRRTGRFIGMHLALELKAKNHLVIGMDNFNNLMNSTSLKILRYRELSKAGM